MTLENSNGGKLWIRPAECKVGNWAENIFRLYMCCDAVAVAGAGAAVLVLPVRSSTAPSRPPSVPIARASDVQYDIASTAALPASYDGGLPEARKGGAF